jgi:hypothetical protein
LGGRNQQEKYSDQAQGITLKNRSEFWVINHERLEITENVRQQNGRGGAAFLMPSSTVDNAKPQPLSDGL